MKSYLDDLPDGGKDFDPYFVPNDWARLQYGRLLWKNPKMRNRLLSHWQDKRHPWHSRFAGERRKQVEKLLLSDSSEDGEIDEKLRQQGSSLRAVMREIPPVFGSFF